MADEASGSSDAKEMSFFDHLEELRWRIIKGLSALIIASIVCAFFSDWLVQDLLLGPLRAAHLKVQVLAPYGIMVLYMEVILFAGLIVSMPVLLYQIWKFVAPGLMPKERQYIWWIVFFTSFCFLAGIAFGYFILVPTALTFFAGFGTQNIDLNIAADRYISFIMSLVVGAGLVFELPMIVVLSHKTGVPHPGVHETLPPACDRGHPDHRRRRNADSRYCDTKPACGTDVRAV